MKSAENQVPPFSCFACLNKRFKAAQAITITFTFQLAGRKKGEKNVPLLRKVIMDPLLTSC